MWKRKKAMVFRPPLYQKMYPICSAIVEKMPVKSIKMFCFRLQVPCYNVATKYVPLLRCTTLSCFRALFAAVWNSAYNFCTTTHQKRVISSRRQPSFFKQYSLFLSRSTAWAVPQRPCRGGLRRAPSVQKILILLKKFTHLSIIFQTKVVHLLRSCVQF